MRDSCGSSRTGETPQASRGGSSHAPLKSEHPGVEIHELLFSIATKFTKIAKNSSTSSL